MSMIHPEARQRARHYAERHGRALVRELGWGKDGIVFETEAGTAIKALKYAESYVHERDVYLRLFEREISHVSGFKVPTLLRHDDELQVIEIGIVSPPCVVDFANAGLDRPLSDFPPDIIAEADRVAREVFEHHWPEVRRLRSAFRAHGIHLSDIRRENIQFADEQGEENPV